MRRTCFESSRRNVVSYSVAMACLTVAWVMTSAANAVAQGQETQSGGALAAAIESAQKRTVKIYGAAIGREPGYASGVLVSADGHVLTATSVLLQGERLRVVLADGSVHQAQVVRRSEPLQAVLLKIKASTPHHFTLPKQPAVKYGDFVVALSNAFKVADGEEWLSVTKGIVAGRMAVKAKRGTQPSSLAGELLMIDTATSNPGAPGGAVVDQHGKLAGMIGPVVEFGTTGTRMNYAIPADRLVTLLSDEQPATSPNNTSKPVAGELGLKIFALSRRDPPYVGRVQPGSPAAAAGIQPDDLILAIDGEQIRDSRGYQQAVGKLIAGKAVSMTVKRKRTVREVTVTPRPVE